MKKPMGLAFLLLFSGFSFVYAQDYTITRILFIPAVYHVGDTVEMRVSLRTAFGKKLSIPKSFVQPSWGNVSNLRLIEREEEPELRLDFVSYNSGTRALPSLNLGPIALEGMNIFVTSLVGNGLESTIPSGSREQAFLPFTLAAIVAQIAVILLIPLLLFLGTRFFRKFLQEFLSSRRDRMPWRRMQRSLSSILSHIESFDARSFYIRLLDETRLYLSDRLKLSAFSATSSELETSLKHCIHHQETVASLIALFRHGDRVKFAGEPASIQARVKDIQTLEAVLLHIEREEQLRRMSAPSRREAANVDT